MTRQELYAQRRVLIQQIQDIADGYAELSKKTDRVLKTQNNEQITRSRAEARCYAY